VSTLVDPNEHFVLPRPLRDDVQLPLEHRVIQAMCLNIVCKEKCTWNRRVVVQGMGKVVYEDSEQEWGQDTSLKEATEG
jgi:hypothetical protein